MLDADQRTAIFQLRERGHGMRFIARNLGVSRGAVQRALKQGAPTVPRVEREEKLTPHRELVETLLQRCEGSRLRAYEELNKELLKEHHHGHDRSDLEMRPANDDEEEVRELVPYSTFTAFCRRHRLAARRRRRAGRYDFEPGEEMQHDTSPHDVVVGGKKRRLQCASLVLCYSRMIYAQLYPRFRRFDCKLFLGEALEFFGAAAGRCEVDNSAVVVARGTGKNAVMAPEMELFARRYGFEFEAHALGHANRSARVERPFHYIENNFYVGRRFDDLTGANARLRTWCGEKNQQKKRHLMNRRPVDLFEEERPFLTPVPDYLPEESLEHVRIVDLQGDISLDCNKYSAPEELIGRQVNIRESKDRVRIFVGHRVVAEHPRLEPGIARRSTLPGHRVDRAFRWNRKGSRDFPELPEEKVLETASAIFKTLVDIFRRQRGGRSIPLIRRLHRLYLDYPTEILERAVSRALEHKLHDLERIERMVLKDLGDEFFRLPFEESWEEESHD